LSNVLTQWQTSGSQLHPVIDRSPALKEIKPLAHNLTQLGETGLQALSYLKGGAPPPPEWRDLHLAKLEEAAKPYAALELVVVSGVKQLVQAASEIKR
jgi:hexosaminidase